MAWRPALLAFLVLPAASLAGCVHDDNAWALEATGLGDLQGLGLRGLGVRVAILDTGIDLDAPSLRHLGDDDRVNGELVAYADFVGDAGGPKDTDGHGTFVAGVLAGGPESGLGRLGPGAIVAGAAPHVELIVGRVSAGEEGSLRALALGLAWALDQHADIVSLSIGVAPEVVAAQPDTKTRLDQLLARAERDGVLVVAAHGNAGLLYPASEATVLAVGSADRDLRPLQAVGLGKPDVFAPGKGITGPGLGSGLVAMDGTSAAVPFVVAAAALVIDGGTDPYDAKSVARLRASLVEASAGPQATPGLLRADLGLAAYVRPFSPRA